MSKQTIRDRFNSFCEGSPHFVYRFNWKSDEPTVTTIYNGFSDVRFGPEHKNDMSKRYKELGITGIKNLPLKEAERIVQESKQFYRN